jgi:hypothetical protein
VLPQVQVTWVSRYSGWMLGFMFLLLRHRVATAIERSA